jgi:hypothetical protein
MAERDDIGVIFVAIFIPLIAIVACLYLCCRRHRRQGGRTRAPLPSFMAPTSTLPFDSVYVKPLFRPAPTHPKHPHFRQSHPTQPPFRPPPPDPFTSNYPQPPGGDYRARQSKRATRFSNTTPTTDFGQSHISCEVYGGVDVTLEMFGGQAYFPEHDQRRIPQLPNDVYGGWDVTYGRRIGCERLSGDWSKVRDAPNHLPTN